MARPLVPSLVKVRSIEAGAIFFVNETTMEQAEEFVDEFFEGEGYRLEKGELGDGRYGKGNPILRLILGAFYPRYAFSVAIDEGKGGNLEVMIVRAETGYAGGLIGRSQVLTEEKRIINEFRSVLEDR